MADRKEPEPNKKKGKKKATKKKVKGGIIWSCLSPGIYGCSFMCETQGMYQILSNVSFLPP